MEDSIMVTEELTKRFVFDTNPVSIFQRTKTM